ncbi:MAG TPA: phasin family protein, partial [Xanthomonadaceae bacterium]|nr:phasin family protein [Xanthomonadaceae bacterium]
GSAQHIWMAGVGAFNRAQEEGTRLFEALVKEGMNIESKTRKLATGKVDAVRDAVEERVGQVRGRAADTWDRLEKVFEERVQRALTRLGVPGREEIAALIDRVDQLNRELRKLSPVPAHSKAAKKAAPAKKASASKAPSAKKAAKKVAAAAIDMTSEKAVPADKLATKRPRAKKKLDGADAP